MIIEKFKNIIKNHPDKTAILFKEKGRIIVKNFVELYYDMFRMISYVENKGVEPGLKMITKYDNNYGTLLLLLAALYRNYEVFFLTKDYYLENVKKYDFFCGNGFIESLLKPKQTKTAALTAASPTGCRWSSPSPSSPRPPLPWSRKRWIWRR